MFQALKKSHNGGKLRKKIWLIIQDFVHSNSEEIHKKSTALFLIYEFLLEKSGLSLTIRRFFNE
ncbi:hypothetical protein HMPREF0621_1349 [Pasteurella dagmatis ATCC 43325]|uniref:Uncharacterized protein n=1 Tax=Pasteurella dagmatis ATCC 43325 TaxID=667128 RepID=C9PQS5_9PAST|nr:hypothetical protein HMPREF0621_1349 [Pasteurella dagmatis ATCC 43325]